MHGLESKYPISPIQTASESDAQLNVMLKSIPVDDIKKSSMFCPGAIFESKAIDGCEIPWKKLACHLVFQFLQ